MIRATKRLGNLPAEVRAWIAARPGCLEMLPRVAQAMEADEPLDPEDISLLDAAAVVSESGETADAVQEFRHGGVPPDGYGRAALL